jgi:cobalt-zinc-cadmium efflux system protein
MAFVLVELVIGVIAHSMTLGTDAGHNFSDVLGLALGWRRAPSGRRRRIAGLMPSNASSILAGLANAALLLAALGAITSEAIQRFGRPEPIQTGGMTWVASVGIVFYSLTRGSFPQFFQRA